MPEEPIYTFDLSKDEHGCISNGCKNASGQAGLQASLEVGLNFGLDWF